MKRHVFITGGGTGIGRAIALDFAARGDVVSLAGRREAPLAVVADLITAGGGRATIISDFDVAEEESVVSGVARARSENGPIGVLVNNAGEAPSAPFEQTDLSLWTRILSVNLTGTYLVTRAALGSLREAGQGRIINIASTAGLAGYAYVSAYCAAKHGVVGLTRALALELARTGITVNAVCPGYTDTPLLDGAVETISRKTGRSEDEAKAVLARANPQGRLVSPSEVADAVRWLASSEASSITGQAIAVAGGEVMVG